MEILARDDGAGLTHKILEGMGVDKLVTTHYVQDDDVYWRRVLASKRTNEKVAKLGAGMRESMAERIHLQNGDFFALPRAHAWNAGEAGAAKGRRSEGWYVHDPEECPSGWA
jgi:hypothetical protein